MLVFVAWGGEKKPNPQKTPTLWVDFVLRRLKNSQMLAALTLLKWSEST